MPALDARRRPAGRAAPGEEDLFSLLSSPLGTPFFRCSYPPCCLLVGADDLKGTRLQLRRLSGGDAEVRPSASAQGAARWMMDHHV